MMKLGNRGEKNSGAYMGILAIIFYHVRAKVNPLVQLMRTPSRLYRHNSPQDAWQCPFEGHTTKKKNFKIQLSIGRE